MKPRKERTSVGFLGYGHSAMPLIFVGSIWIVLFSSMTPRNSIHFCVNMHFSGLRYRSCFSSLSRILWMHFLWNTGSSGVAMSISSMYTVSQPSWILSSNIAFIMAWKVAGELVMPKNMTVGSYNPSLVMKAAFHLSPFLMCTLLYPQQTLNLVKSFFILTRLINCGIRGSGYWLHIVHSFRH